DLGVRVGGEDVPGRRQTLLQLDVVLDDAVVDDRHAAVLGEMRVGVDIVGLAVGSPARVPEPQAAHRQVAGDGVLERLQLAGTLGGRQPQHGGRGDGDDKPGRVVATVLKTAEAVQEDVSGLPAAYVTDDSTHGERPLEKALVIAWRSASIASR